MSTTSTQSIGDSHINTTRLGMCGQKFSGVLPGHHASQWFVRRDDRGWQNQGLVMRPISQSVHPKTSCVRSFFTFTVLIVISA